MGKNLNVNLTFTANTQQAKIQLQQLQTQLNALTTNTTLGTNLTADIQEGIAAASQLKNMLASATNVETGKLNLSQFNQSLSQTGMTLSQFGLKLSALGPQGKTAFQDIARSIANAQVPLRATNTMLDKMWTTMANTMRWQISASVLQGFMSTIQGAYQYAQDLNESLNNIRIVTGQSVEQMDAFAEKANKAAKALSTSTTAYTDAALIYYQQGLSDKQVEERTNATIKLANVVGETAQTVSEWMTSIWNNFDDGSKSLEYYADVLAALGAETASSADEIAGGLEKFAAVAETVGLSYEYAASALATITAQTRQSEDVVGTALKTIFARIQDLELGNTLDDGTSLGQYAEALQKIGVEVLDATGDLRDMNDVLNDMGAKWDNLSQAQKVATAQSVAGIRQYNQLLALMDNWDFFELNLDIAVNSEGTLEEQAEIFAESWEAASQRVKAAAEELYTDLLDDDFFIGLTDGFGYLLQGISEVIDAMGGLKGLLPLLIVGFTKLFGEKMLVSIKNFSNSMKLSSASAQQMALSTKQEALNLMQAYAGDSHAGSLEVNELELQKKVYDINRMLTEEEQKQVQLWFDQLSTIRSVVAELEKMSQAGKQQQNQFDDAVAQAGPLGSQGQVIHGNAAIVRTENQARVTKNAEMAMLEAARFDADMVADSKEDLRNKVLDSKHDFAGKSDIQNQASLATADADAELFEFNEDSQKWKMKSNALDKEATIQTQKLSKAYSGYNKQIDNFDELLGDKIAGMKKDAKATAGAEKATDLYNKEIKNVDKNIKQMSKTPLSNSIMATTQSIASLSMGISTLITTFDTLWDSFKNGNMSFGDFFGMVTSMSIAIPMLISGFIGLQGAIGGMLATNVLNNGSILASNILLMQQKKLTTDQIGAVIGLKMAKALENGETEQSVLAMGTELLMKKLGMTQDQAQTAATYLLKGAKDSETKSRWANVAAMIAEKVAAGPVMWIVIAIAAAVALVTAGFIALFNIIQNSSADAKLAAEKEQLNEMNEALEKTKESYNELKNAIEDYKSGADALKTMVKGTEEWRDAVLELNNQVLELISKYPELSQYLSSEDGILTLGQEGLDKALDAAYKTMQDQTTATLAQRAVVAELKQEVEWINTQANNKKYSNYGQGSTGNYRYESDSGDVYLGDSELAYSQFFDEMKGLYDKFGQDLFTNNEEVKTEIGKLNKTYQEAWEKIKTDSDFQAVLTGFDKLNQELKALAMSIAMSELGNNQAFINSQYQDAIANQYSDRVAKALENDEYNGIKRDKWLEHLISSYDSSDSFNGDVQDAKEIRKAGLKGITSEEDLAKWIVAKKTGYSTDQIGYGSSSIVQIDNTGGDTIEYKGPDDDEWKKVDYEDYAEQLWIEYVTQQENTRVKEMSKQAETIGKKIADAGIKDQSQISTMVADYIEGNTIDLSGLTRQEISEIDTSKMDAELQQAFEEAIDGYIEARAEANRQASIKWIEETDQREATALSDALKTAEMTTDDFNDYVKAIQKAKGVSEKIADEIARDSIKASNALSQVNEVLKDQKEALLGTDKSSAGYIAAINDITAALTEWLGIELDDNVISAFVEDGTFYEAIEGSQQAIDKLHAAAAKQFVINMDIEGITNEDGTNYFDVLSNKIDEISNRDISIGASLDDTEFVNTLNDMLAKGLITADQVSGYLNSIGYDPDIETVPVESRQNHTIYLNNPLSGIIGPEEFSYSYGTSTTIEVPKINGKGTVFSGKSAPTVTPASSGKSGSSSKKDTKKASEEIDRYHEIKEAIEDVENELDRLSKAKDRAFGKDKLAFMEAEQRSLKEQITLQEQLVAAMKSDLVKDQEELNKWGFSTDESGRITNYEEVYKQRIAEYNDMVKKGQKDEADEQWEEFEEAVEQYEETLNNLESEETELMNQRYDAEEKRLSDIQTIVEDNLEMTEDKLEDIEHQLSKIEDNAFAAAEAIALIGQEAESSMGDLETYETGIRNILKMETANGSKMSDEEVDKLLAGDMSVLNGKELTEEQINGLREYRSGIYETIQQTEDYADTVKDKVLENFEAWNERLERQGSLLEHNHSILKSYRNIVDLVGADNLGISDETVSQMTQQTVDNANASLEHARITRDANKTAYEEAKEAFAKGAIDEEQMNAIEDAYLESEQNFMDSWNSALEAAGEAFDSEVERILAKFDEAMGNLEEKLDWFDKLQAKNEIFLKDYEQTYEISKLNRQIQNSIDTTDNIKNSQALRNIQKDLLSYQEEGKEMSKYDLEYLQKKYDLEVARIALEEAQNAKSQVRLTRDSEGNFGYTYTADSEAVEKAEQNYEDKMYEMEKFLDESSTEIQEQIMTWNQMMMEELGALDKSADDYDEKAQAIVDHYTGLINSISQEGEEILIRGKEMNEEYGTHAAEVFNETIMGKLYSDIGSYQEFNNQMQIAISETLSDLEGNHQTYQQNVDGIFDTAGTDVGDFKNEVVEYLGEVDQANKDILETTGGMATDMASDFDDVVNEAVRFSELYKNALKPAMEAAEALAQRIGEVIEAYNNMPDAEDIPIPDNPNDDDDRSSSGDNTKTIKDDDTGISNKSDKKEEVANPDLNDGTWWYRGTKEENGKKYISAADTKDATETKWLEVTGGANDLWEKAKNARGTFSFDESELSKKKKKETDKDPPFEEGDKIASSEQRKDGGINQVRTFYENSKGKMVTDWFVWGTTLEGKEIDKKITKDGKTYYSIKGIKSTGGNTAWFLESQLVPYDTGGYTGSWGPEGRLAMLHQKEIVLNANDTENFLTAIGIVRDISDQIEKNAILMQYQNQLANYRASVGNSGETLQQEVHITAEFPNATDHNEIEEAFKNLTNLASQYANRKF